MKVLGDVDRPAYAVSIRVAQLQRLAGGALACLQQRQQLTEHLGRIASVDLLDDNDELGCGLLLRSLDGFHEDTIGERQLAFTSRPPAAHEVFVRKIRVELDGSHLALVLLPHQGEGQSLGQPCLAGAGWPLQDQILFGAQPVQ